MQNSAGYRSRASNAAHMGNLSMLMDPQQKTLRCESCVEGWNDVRAIRTLISNNQRPPKDTSEPKRKWTKALILTIKHLCAHL